MFLPATDGQPGMRFNLRIQERDTYLPLLAILSHSPDGFMKTSELIKQLEHHMDPIGEDRKILANRSDTRFSQIVRNVVSHRTVPTNIIGAGLADYDKVRRGLKITETGREALRNGHPILNTEP